MRVLRYAVALGAAIATAVATSTAPSAQQSAPQAVFNKVRAAAQRKRAGKTPALLHAAEANYAWRQFAGKNLYSVVPASV